MATPTIHFDDERSRVVIDDILADGVVAGVAHAFVRSFRTGSGTVPDSVAIGYDGRRSSSHAASVFAGVLSSYGVRVLLSSAIIPTPVLTHAVVVRACGAGVMLTGGDAPAHINGIVFIASSGRRYTSDELRSIEACLIPEAESFAAVSGNITPADLIPAYIDHMHRLVDVTLLGRFGGDPRSHAAVIIDSMGGAGQTLLEDVLSPLGWRAQTIFGTADATFYDRIPEAVRGNLEPLTYNVSVTDTLFGIATDGDAAGCAVVYDNGEVMTAEDTLLILDDHLRRHGRAVAAGIAAGDVLGHDAVLTGLFIAEMIAAAELPLRAIVEGVRARAAR